MEKKGLLESVALEYGHELPIFLEELFLFFRIRTHPEGLDIIHGNLIAEEVEESILEHAAVAVPGG